MQQLHRQLTNAHDKFMRLEESSAEKREAAAHRMQMLKEKHSRVEKARGEMLAEHDLLRKEIEQIEQEVRRERRLHWFTPLTNIALCSRQLNI